MANHTMLCTQQTDTYVGVTIWRQKIHHPYNSWWTIIPFPTVFWGALIIITNHWLGSIWSCSAGRRGIGERHCCCVSWYFARGNAKAFARLYTRPNCTLPKPSYILAWPTTEIPCFCGWSCPKRHGVPLFISLLWLKARYIDTATIYNTINYSKWIQIKDCTTVSIFLFIV